MPGQSLPPRPRGLLPASLRLHAVFLLLLRTPVVLDYQSTLLRYVLILTNYTRDDRVSKPGPILRSWGVRPSTDLLGGLSSTQGL